MHEMSVIGVILAGGTGTRFGGAVPKQYTKLAGRMIIEHTIDVFQKHTEITEILVVCQNEFIDKTWSLVNANGWDKVSKVIAGGSDRFESTLSAIRALSSFDGSSKVVFHDAVRPFVTTDIIDRCVSALDYFQAVDVVIASTDTIVSVRDNGSIDSIPNRSLMRRGQTPQAFRLEAVTSAYERALQLQRRDFTCDCGVVRCMLPHLEVATVEGSEFNIKITNPLDLHIAEKLMQSRASNAVLDSTLDQLDGKRIVVFGGSRGIGKSIRDLALVNGADAIIASRTTNSVDVGDFESVQSFLDDVRATKGPIDAIINTAGVLIKKPMHQMSPQQIAEVIDVNYRGAVNVALASRSHLLESEGALINFTSSSYTRGRAFYAIYSSTKCAIVNLSQALSEEWYDDRIRVNCINPERTRTPMRTSNFGYEDPLSLLDPDTVATATLNSVTAKTTGLIIDVRKNSVLMN